MRRSRRGPPRYRRHCFPVSQRNGPSSALALTPLSILYVSPAWPAGWIPHDPAAEAGEVHGGETIADVNRTLRSLLSDYSDQCSQAGRLQAFLQLSEPGPLCVTQRARVRTDQKHAPACGDRPRFPASERSNVSSTPTWRESFGINTCSRCPARGRKRNVASVQSKAEELTARFGASAKIPAKEWTQSEQVARWL